LSNDRPAAAVAGAAGPEVAAAAGCHNWYCSRTLLPQ